MIDREEMEPVEGQEEEGLDAQWWANNFSFLGLSISLPCLVAGRGTSLFKTFLAT